MNLLSNALKFTFEGDIAVTLRRDGDEAELALCVRDTGVGIAPAELPKLFERFHRIRGSKSRSHEGSGIRLALVRDLEALHGGSVDASSEVGIGTTFRVRIPLGSAHLDPGKILGDRALCQRRGAVPGGNRCDDASRWRARAFERRQNYCGGSHPALAADDNADLRDYVGDVLSSRYEVTCVKNGREALAAAQAGTFDLIVSDVMMPEMDGTELLRAVRSDERIAATPFIMLSARAGEESALEGLTEGADDYVVKPFSTDELLARVGAQINAAKLREQGHSRSSRQRGALSHAGGVAAVHRVRERRPRSLLCG